MKKYINKQKGFMLTEVLITVMLIVITMVGVLPLLFSGMKAVKISKGRAIVTNLAQKEIEGFNQKDFSTVINYIKSNRSVPQFNDFLEHNVIYNDLKPDFYININNGSISSTLANGYKKVSLIETYSFLKGEETITDDAVQFSVNMYIQGERPVILSSILSRDKIEKQ